MRKALLSLAALALMGTANAQLLNYGFETADILPGAILNTNWENYADANFTFQEADAFAGQYALGVNTFDTANRWERVIAFDGVDIKPMKSYRVSFMAKGTGTINVGILQGAFYRDMALKAGTADASTDQLYDKAIANETEWVRVSQMIWSPSLETQQSFWTGDTILTEDYFLRLAFTGIGNYKVDNVKIEESSIDNITFNGDAIVVDFGYATNAATLANGNVLQLDPSCVSVNVNGEAAEIDAVEIKKDGQFCIFLAGVELTEEDKVSVSFTNNIGLKYSTSTAPESFETPNAAVYSFEDEVATYDETLVASSYAYEEAEFVGSTPADGSFEIDPATDTFTFTYNKPVLTSFDGDPAIATLAGGTVNEQLILVESDEANETLTFKRPEGAEAFAKGTYSLTISNVYNEKGIAKGTEDIVSFEVGQVSLAETVYTEIGTTLLQGANGAQPTSWSIMVGGENWTGGEPKADNGSACRNLNVTGNDGVEYTAFYLCDRDGYTYMMYGDQEGANITLPKGNIEFSVIGLSHDDAGHTLEYRIEDLEGNEIATASASCTVIANTQFTAIAASDFVTVKFANDAERNVILKVRAPQGGYTAVRVLGFKIRSYVMTEGDKETSEVVLKEDFSSYGGNMPSAGSGWTVYENGNPLEPGSGRSGTSGILNLGTGGMPAAFFARECSTNYPANMYITYGEMEGVEPLTLSAGSYDITYKSATWNDNDGNANGNSKSYFQLIDAESGEVVFEKEHVNSTDANYKNGVSNNPDVAADKVAYTFNTDGGTYIVKVWGSHNTVQGDILIEKPGSKAVKYHSQLNKAVESAKAELETSEDAMYDGTTKSALIAAVEKYSQPVNGMHTGAEYDAAVADLEAMTKALAVRRSTVGKYDTAIKNISAMIGTVEDKYKALDCYQTLESTYATYETVTAQSLEDAELISAATTLTNAYELTNHMITDGVATLTAQITALAEAIQAYDSEMAANEQVIAAGNAITDDQKIAAALKLIRTKQIYEMILAGDPFDSYDEEFDLHTPVTIDATSYIQNPGIYCVAVAHDATNISNYPGWNTTEDKQTFGLRPNYGWGGWTGTATHTVNANMFLGIGWIGNDGIDVWNNVSGLPVGQYSLNIQTMDRSGVGTDAEGNKNVVTTPERQQSYIYYQQGENEPTTQAFNVADIGDYYGFTDDTFENPLQLTGETVADVKIGAYIHAQESFAAIQKVTLKMTGKDANFDYAAAIKQLDELIAAGIELQERDDQPVSVVTYDLNGRRAAAANGISIRVERYADGYTVVKKVIK